MKRLEAGQVVGVVDKNGDIVTARVVLHTDKGKCLDYGRGRIEEGLPRRAQFVLPHMSELLDPENTVKS